MEEQDKGEWQAARRSEGVETGPLPPLDTPVAPQGWAPPLQAPPQGPAGYVPPPGSPQATPYAPYSAPGEPTNRWEPLPIHVRPHQPREGDKRQQRMPILGPLFLIGLGALFTLNTFDIVPWGIWGQIWRLWPLILIAIGLEMVLGKRNPLLALVIVLGLMGAGVAFLYTIGGFEGGSRLLRSPLAIPLSQARSATLNIKFDDGELKLSKLTSDDDLLVGGTLEYSEKVGEPYVNVRQEGIAPFIEIEERSDSSFLDSSTNPSWEMRLNTGVSYRLRVDTGASDATLDFEGLKIEGLDLTMGANSTEIVFPEAAGLTTATISGGASNLDITIPRSVEARIQVSSGLSSIDIDDRFKQEREGDPYISEGYFEATNKLDLTLQLGASNVDIESR